MSIAKLDDLIDNEKFEHHFQALYDLHTLKPIGYEALLRTELFKNPQILFDEASQTDRFFDLEIQSVKKALRTYKEINQQPDNDKKILINVFPSNLADNSFFSELRDYTKELALLPEQIIIEINESESMFNMIPLYQNVERLQEAGYLIALDDVGKGISTLQAIVDLQPDFVKLDRYFAKDLAKSTRKQEMIRALSLFCKNTGSEFVLEGIEIAEDLEVAKSIGVTIVQGFLLARPEPVASVIARELSKLSIH